MNKTEFLSRVVCPQCNSRIIGSAPFNSSNLLCNCRLSRHIINGSHHTVKLFLSKEMVVIVTTYGSEEIESTFYVASEDRVFYPLLYMKEIPDFIFLPLNQLIQKLKILISFT